MKIPSKLNKKEFRFIKLRGTTKEPLERNWTSGTNYTYEDISDWVANGNNYGVATGYGNLLVIDCDVELADEFVKNNLPETFSVKTGSGGLHYYYYVDNSDYERLLQEFGVKKFVLWYRGDIHAVDLQWQGHQVVGAGSIHPDTKQPYKVNSNKSIATLSIIELKPLIENFTLKKKNPKPMKSASHKGFNLDISKVIEKVPELQILERKGKDLQGVHPVHGSSTKINFCIDDENNTFYCFRCSTGGDTLHLIAMLEGMIECKDVGYTEIKGKHFIRLLKIAKEKYGYTDEELQQEELKEEPKSLQDVHNTFEQYMFVKDKTPIDLALALALTNQKKGTPVWMIFVGASSGGKSTILRSLSDIPKAVIIDDITENTLASGAKDKEGNAIPDLGMRFQGKSTLVVTPDLASLTSHNRDAKRKIWAKFRELFDGYINRETGNDVSRNYKDCHVTWIFGATPVIRSEVLIYAELGTRELMYELNLPDEYDDLMFDKAWDNENYEEEMKKSLMDVVRKFYKSHTYNDDISIPDSIKEFIRSESRRLEVLRATAPKGKNGELLSDIVEAKFFRSGKQLKKIYKGLKSLDENYDDEMIKDILRRIVDSTSNPVRTNIMKMHEVQPDNEFTYWDYVKNLRLSRTIVKSEALALWNAGYLIKKVTTKTIHGKTQEVDLFSKNKNSKFKFVR